MQARLLILLTAAVMVAAAWAAVQGRKLKAGTHRKPAGKAAAGKLGLYVRSGKLMHKGREFRGFGINYFGAFGAAILNPDKGVPRYQDGFKVIRKYNIPVIRFMAGTYSAANWKLYQTNRTEYFKRFDAFVAEAEKQDIGLIGSLFWRRHTITALHKEHHSAVGDPQSKSCNFARTYIKEVVGRYTGSPAIWGWEIGNEYNLQMDLPNWPGGMTSPDTIKFFEMCANDIRKYDRHRVILSGNSRPRESAWHNTNAKRKRWRPDTLAQYTQIIARDNPDPIDTLSIHTYEIKPGLYFADKPVDYAGFLRETVAIGSRLDKPVIIGEFGVDNSGELKDNKKRFAWFLSNIAKAGVPLAMVWVYDHGGAEGWGIKETNSRKYQLEMLSAANKRICPVIIDRSGKSAGN